jgi:threonine/homoserine/homoserine lactone efflux protein
VVIKNISIRSPYKTPLIAENSRADRFQKETGAYECYLLYLGMKLLLSARQPYRELEISTTQNTTTPAPQVGLLVCATNPKAAALLGSFFITVIPVHAPSWVLAAAVVVVTTVSFPWLSTLALMFSTDRVRACYAKMRRPIDAVMGGVWVSLGLRLGWVR